MKTMTCKQLGGACDKAFHADTFEEIAEMSQQHGAEMFAQKEEAHLLAMSKIQALMKRPNAMESWFKEKRQAFDALADD